MRDISCLPPTATDHCLLTSTTEKESHHFPSMPPLLTTSLDINIELPLSFGLSAIVSRPLSPSVVFKKPVNFQLISSYLLVWRPPLPPGCAKGCLLSLLGIQFRLFSELSS